MVINDRCCPFKYAFKANFYSNEDFFSISLLFTFMYIFFTNLSKIAFKNFLLFCAYFLRLELLLCGLEIAMCVTRPHIRIN